MRFEGLSALWAEDGVTPANMQITRKQIAAGPKIFTNFIAILLSVACEAIKGSRSSGISIYASPVDEK
jgi:hypothetical protein